jgi:DNA-binding transcriptional LysR family regulator
MISVNRMRMLREVATHGGIAAAAEALYMSPSAVSQQMAVLEREAGTPLLERHGRGVRLTAAGESLVAHTDRVLAILEEAQADLADISASVAGSLRTCAFPTAARALLVPALSLLKERHPRLRLHMNDMEPEESIPLLKRGELDVIVSYGYDRIPEQKDPSVERLSLMTEPLHIALPAHHPQAAGDVRVRLADLAEEQWIVGRDGSPFMEIMLRVANEAGFTPDVDLHSNDYQVILAAVEAGLGVALVPPLARFSTYPGVVFRQCADVDINRRIVAVIRSGSMRAPAVSAVLQALREVAYQVEA